MSIIFALAMLGVPNDGLPTYTAAQAKEAGQKWDDCLKEQADRAATYTSDPSTVVVDVAIELCDREMSNARFMWRRYIVVASTRNLTDAQAEAAANDYFAERLDRNRKYLLGRVSQTRQIQALDREIRASRQ